MHLFGRGPSNGQICAIGWSRPRALGAHTELVLPYFDSTDGGNLCRMCQFGVATLLSGYSSPYLLSSFHDAARKSLFKHHDDQCQTLSVHLSGSAALAERPPQR